jgi:hypothetical protein
LLAYTSKKRKKEEKITSAESLGIKQGNVARRVAALNAQSSQGSHAGVGTTPHSPSVVEPPPPIAGPSLPPQNSPDLTPPQRLRPPISPRNGANSGLPRSRPNLPPRNNQNLHQPEPPPPPPAPTPPTHGEMKAAKRAEKQALQQALATKKDLDAGGLQIALRAAKAKEGKMYFDRPKTVLAIPSPFGTRREDGSIYKHKIKLFRKSNKEWVNTQLAAHTEAEGLRDQHEQVFTKNQQAHKLGQEAATRRYAASTISGVGDAAAGISTLTGGADGFTASIGTTSKIAAAVVFGMAARKSAQAESLTGKAISDLPQSTGTREAHVKEALDAIKDGHSAAKKNATRKKREAMVQSVGQSTGLVGDHVGMASGSEAVLDSKGSALRGQGVEGHAWTFGKPTAFTAAETGLDTLQDASISASTNVYRPVKNALTVGGGNKSHAKGLQQHAAVREVEAYRKMKASKPRSDLDTPNRMREPSP